MDSVRIALPAHERATDLATDSSGDSHSSPGMLEFQDLIKEVHPGIFIHSVRIEEALDKDREAGFVSALRSNSPRLISPRLYSTAT